MSSDPVPAITEAAARGKTAEIFADLRATLGVSVVNLIWRHLATLPDALPWAWATVKPVYVSGRVAAEAKRIKLELVLPAAPVWPPALLDCAGVDAAGAILIRHVLASYNRSNALNLAALSALIRRIDGAPATTVPAGSAPAQDAPIEGALPKLLALDEVSVGTAELIRRINLLGNHNEGRITASMYRHLAHWPGFLSLCYVQLAPLAADGRLEKMIDATVVLGDAAGARLQSGLAKLPAPASATDVRLATSLFIQHAIGRMVPIAALLIAALSAKSDAR